MEVMMTFFFLLGGAGLKTRAKNKMQEIERRQAKY